jgi:predicted metalloprotease
MALPVGGGIGGLVLLLLFSMLTGQNPIDYIDTSTPEQTTGTSSVPADDPQAEFVSVVLADTEDTWGEIFAQRGSTYPAPTLVLFTEATQSACGVGQSAMGPFYCPNDRKVYLDLSFFHDLETRFGAPGDFAQAYVVAHEVGHHVQTVTGISDRVASARQYGSERAGSRRQRLSATIAFSGKHRGAWFRNHLLTDRRKSA